MSLTAWLKTAYRNQVAGHSYRTGLIHAREARWPEALEAFRSAVASNPRDPDAQAELAGAYARLGQFEEALAAYRAACTLKPDDARLRGDSAEAGVRLGRFDEAIAAYSAGLRLEPSSAWFQARIGICYGKLGRIDQAIEAYQAALAIDADLALAHWGLGLARAEQGQAVEATRFLRRAIKLSPNLSTAKVQLEASDADLARWEGGIRSCGGVLPELVEAQLPQGTNNSVEFSLQRWQELATAYQAALEREPDLASAHYVLGMVAGVLQEWRSTRPKPPSTG